MEYTLIIIVVTAVVSMMAFRNELLYNKLILWPKRMDTPGEYYRLLTSGFIHADWPHLIFNMITLYFFGNMTQQFFAMLGKPWLFVVLYLMGIVVASLPSFYKHRQNSFYRSLGASGGVSAVLFSFVYIAPWDKILIFFLPVPGIIAAIGYLIYSAYASRQGRDAINHDAHFWGAVFGFLFTLVFDPTHGRIFFEQLIHPRF